MAETCFFHTDREAGRHCTRCDRPACEECLHQAPVGSHCWQCIKAAQPPRSEQVRRRLRMMPTPLFSVVFALNLAMFVVTLGGYGARGERLLDDLAVNIVGVADGEWWRLITGGFVHAGLMHFGFNMFLLYQVCRMFEPTLGSLRLAGVYGAALLAGSFGSILLQPRQPAVGASGAVLGVVAGVSVALWHRGASFWNTGFGPYLVIVLLWSFIDSRIAWGGHLGGAIGGAIVGYCFFDLREPRRAAVATVGWIAAAIVGLGAVIGSVVVADRTVTQWCNETPPPAILLYSDDPLGVCRSRFEGAQPAIGSSSTSPVSSSSRSR